MRVVTVLLLVFTSTCFAQPSKETIKRWEDLASRVTIIRDNWGIPHIYGKTDADAVFGLMYAQCEDDFMRVEMNYIEKLSRLSLLQGDSAVYQDLYTKMVIDEAEARKDYEKSPAWLKKLLNAFADGINFYLYKNPTVTPQLLTHFEPWFPLLWTDGSIGAISTGYLTAADVKNFYTKSNEPVQSRGMSVFENSSGSNGFAVSGSHTATGNAMLYINPHVTLYFRPEVHMISEEGLNAYGAVTWGQFFIYQGFNAFNGWMHTSSDVDVSDLYLEKITRKDTSLYYLYDGVQKPVSTKQYTIAYKKGLETLQAKIKTYSTHHGPVMSSKGDHWVSVRSNNRSLNGLIQSWQRTKTKGLRDYIKVMNLKANTSNNTVYADNKGNIAYWHGNFIPVRDPKLNWATAVDGSTSATEWRGLHKVDETVHIYNPPNGWIQNCNSSPFSVAGKNSPTPSDYPRYMAPDGENYRGVNAVRVFSKLQKPGMDELIGAGYDRYLAAFEKLVPALVNAFDRKYNGTDTLYAKLKEPIEVLRKWDLHCGEESVGTTLAVTWGQLLIPKMSTSKPGENDYEYVDQVAKTNQFIQKSSEKELIQSFFASVTALINTYGKWNIPWGEINRFQRVTNTIPDVYTDHAPSIPVGYASSVWGMLPSYASRTYPGTRKRYVEGGNSFVCVVEFGKKIRAKSLLAGGQSGNPESKHFDDQAEMFAKGIFKDVLFYKEDVLKHAERTYRPGE